MQLLAKDHRLTHMFAFRAERRVFSYGVTTLALLSAAGWLVLTRGVRAMRTYRIGAILLDLDNPKRILGQLRLQLLSPASLPLVLRVVREYFHPLESTSVEVPRCRIERAADRLCYRNREIS